MAEVEKSPFENLIAGPSGWPEAYHQLQQLIGARGAILFILFAAALLVWWKWEEIVKRPWIKLAIERLKRPAIPDAPAGLLAIAAAHLDDDEDQWHEKLLLKYLSEFEGVEVVRVDRTIKWPTGGSESEKKKRADEEAQGLLRQTGADVLIWGSVISRGDTSDMWLYWTPAREVPGAKFTRIYRPPTEPTIALPSVFWDDLKQILGLLVQSRLAELTFSQSGHYVADKLAPLITQVRTLVQSKEGVWNPETLAGAQFSLANALELDGEQSERPKSLVESIALYRQVLEKLTRARVPLDWAKTQNNLGNALAGERESGTARLGEAVAAYRDALQENTRARVPLDWAKTQNNLGYALQALGERESGTARLEEAVAAFRDALQENTRTRVPLQWAATQNNLGEALLRLGERESGTTRLEEAAGAYREALKEFPRERVPLYWAQSTGNQGVALMLLAERRGDAETAKLAVQQIEAAFTASRDGGDAHSAAMFEAKLPKARALAQKLTKC